MVAPRATNEDVFARQTLAHKACSVQNGLTCLVSGKDAGLNAAESAASRVCQRLHRSGANPLPPIARPDPIADPAGTLTAKKEVREINAPGELLGVAAVPARENGVVPAGGCSRLNKVLEPEEGQLVFGPSRFKRLKSRAALFAQRGPALVVVARKNAKGYS